MESKRYGIVTAVLGMVAFAGLAWIFFLPASKATLNLPGQPMPQLATHPTLLGAYGKLPLSFEVNQGQSDRRVRFLARGNNYLLFLTGDSAVLTLRKSDSIRKGRIAAPISPASLPAPALASTAEGEPKTNDTAFWMRMVGATPTAKVTGQDELDGKSNYYIGNDPKKWHSNVPNYAEVKYASVYPGVDLIYYGNQGQLEFDFFVRPGSDSSRIMLDVGVEPMVSAARPQSAILHIAQNGDLVVNADGGEVIPSKANNLSAGGDRRGRRTADRQVIEGRKYVLVGTHQGRIPSRGL